ncbi:MAG TPA: phosphatase PAP2 family protein [Bryobacteraceae bacterium]|jgi:membrane-associated phospholipid phosphatase|nr:phosphatase PAP2 family protein [Bryobacteraceae bacterium]
MAELLKTRRPDLWPIDKTILAWFAASSLLDLFCWRKLPNPWEPQAVHLAGAMLILLAIRRPGSNAAQVFRHWYPVFYVFYCYKEMSLIIPALRSSTADAALAGIDLAFWGAHPTVWLERISSPALTEILQIAYSGFVPVVLMVGFILWGQKRYREFRYYAFLIPLGFLVSYVGYLLVPARGPRFLLHHLQHFELRGLFLFNWLQSTLDRIESAHYDCFPSGHTEMTILACWGCRMISPKLFRVMFVYTLSIIFATVYLRYHYTVDVLAGIAVAVVLILTAPRVYRALGGDRSQEAG